MSDDLSPEAKALLEAAEAREAELLRKRADKRYKVTAKIADEARKRQTAAHAALDEKRKSEQARQRTEDDSEWYGIGFGITAFIVFIGTWIYCVVAYGFLFGVGLGWLPSAIVAVIVGALWPLLALAIAVIAYLVFTN